MTLTKKILKLLRGHRNPVSGYACTLDKSKDTIPDVQLEVRERYWHVLCSGADLYIQYYRDQTTAEMTVEELRLFSWKYQNSFYTELLHRIFEYYDMTNPSHMAVLEAASVFLNW